MNTLPALRRFLLQAFLINLGMLIVVPVLAVIVVIVLHCHCSWPVSYFSGHWIESQCRCVF